MGENPVVGTVGGPLQRKGLRALDWLVVRDFAPTETAEFWRLAPEIERGELRPEDIATEVFFFPAAAHTEKAGSFTNTQRLLQWHHKAIEPQGDARSELWFAYHLGRRLKQRHADTAGDRDLAIRALTWDYPVEGAIAEPSAEAVLREINGYRVATGAPVGGFTELADDGSTACGCWLYAGCYAGGVNQTARRKPRTEQSYVAPDWGWAWPANRRLMYNRASADADGKPWSERKRYVWWDADRGRWTGEDVPDCIVDRPPGYRPGDDAHGLADAARRRAVHHAVRRPRLAVRAERDHRRPAAGALRARGVGDRQSAVRPAVQSGAPRVAAARQSVSRGGARPAVSVRADHVPADRAPHGGRDEPLAVVARRAPARAVLRGVAGARRRARPGQHAAGRRSARRAPRSSVACW